jgi:N-methylhydantoinase A
VIGRDAVAATPRPGPLVIESYDSTVVVPPDCDVMADAAGDLLLTVRTLQSAS